VRAGEVVELGAQRNGGRVALDLLAKPVGEPVNRRIPIRIVRFWRSTHICALPGRCYHRGVSEYQERLEKLSERISAAKEFL
jgi:hypothetical protein